MRDIFVCIPKRGRGSLCPGLKGSVSIRGEDTYVRVKQLWIFIARENASAAEFYWNSGITRTDSPPSIQLS